MGESTTQTPPDKLPKYIPDKDKICLSREQAENVYEAVENGEQVKPLSVNSSIDEQFPVVNPYNIGLRTNTNSSLKNEPSLEMKKCDLTWSILSTVVDNTECDKNSPYKEINYSPVYSRFTDTKDIVQDDATNHWQERYKEVSCNLYTRNHIPIDGRGVTEAFLMDNTPMNYSLTLGHQEVICQRSIMIQTSPCINYPNLVLPVQV